MGQNTGRLQRRSRVGFRENGPCRKEQQKLALEGSKKGPWKGRSGDRKGNSKGQERLGRRARVNTGGLCPGWGEDWKERRGPSREKAHKSLGGQGMGLQRGRGGTGSGCSCPLPPCPLSRGLQHNRGDRFVWGQV
ncbi:hypothetical protein H8957_005978 [Semnopithecus entellus]